MCRCSRCWLTWLSWLQTKPIIRRNNLQQRWRSHGVKGVSWPTNVRGGGQGYISDFPIIRDFGLVARDWNRPMFCFDVSLQCSGAAIFLSKTHRDATLSNKNFSNFFKAVLPRIPEEGGGTTSRSSPTFSRPSPCFLPPPSIISRYAARYRQSGVIPRISR